ncbi:hypothetical protein EDC04DRAFT_2616631 [Pisolithus marmoratus]|nr:hypothetical protein EDC04DRAFT_2616631 [Pisolithus marmoratus]
MKVEAQCQLWGIIVASLVDLCGYLSEWELGMWWRHLGTFMRLSMLSSNDSRGETQENDAFKHAFHLFAIPRNWITVSLPENVPVILVAPHTGIRLWIEDRVEIILPLSHEALRGMETFLASGFLHIPASTIAPLAVRSFLEATYYLSVTGFIGSFGGDWQSCGDTWFPQSHHSLPRISTGSDHQSGPWLSHIAEESSVGWAVVDAATEAEDFLSIPDTTFILPSSEDGANSFALDSLLKRTGGNEPLFEEPQGRAAFKHIGHAVAFRLKHSLQAGETR